MTRTGESLSRSADKQYLRIGEVSRIVGVPAYVLRFWETEFPRIKPRRTPAGQRLYHRDDLDFILKIKHLLYDRRFTIKGARNHLRIESAQPSSAADPDILGLIRTQLQQIRDLLTS